LIMKNLKIKFGLFSLLTVLVVSIFLTSCEQEAIEQPLVTDYIEAEKILGNHIIAQDGIFVLTEKDPYKLGIDPQLLNTMIERFGNMNQLIRDGEIKAEWINKTLDLETMEEISLEDRGCNENKIDWGWTTIKIYLSTNSASWATTLGGLPLGLVGGAMAAVTQYANQFLCTCGYIHTIGYGYALPAGTTTCNDATPEPCNPPTNANAYNETSGQFTLSWNTTSSADYHWLYYWNNGWQYFANVSSSPARITAPSGNWCVAVEAVCDGIGSGIGDFDCANVLLIAEEDTIDNIQVVQQAEVQ